MKSSFVLIGLALLSGRALATSSTVIDVSLDLNPTVDISNVVVMVELDASGILGYPAVGNNYAGAAGTLAGVATHQDVFFQNHYMLPVIGYSVFAVYGSGAGVAVGIDTPAAAGLVGTPWPFQISPITSESFVQSALTTGNVDPLDPIASEMRASHYISSLGTSDTLVAFSSGHEVGTARASIVPEPATLAVLTIGALGLVRKRKRRLSWRGETPIP